MANKNIFLTCTDVVDSISIDDHTVEIIGYVDVVERPKIVGKTKKFNLMKFAINNGAGRRIQCLAWEGQVAKTAAAVQLNKIIYLDGARSKKIEKSNFNIGDVPFELIINSNTVINDLGDYNNSIDDKVLVVPMMDVANASGKIKVTVYMKTLVALAEHSQGQSSYGIGAITDGTYKLEIHTTSLNNMPPLTKGQPVEVEGTVHYGKVVYLQLTDGSSIKPCSGERLTMAQIINVTQTPAAKKAKVDE